MIDESSRPEVRLAALLRERSAIASKPYKGDEGKETKARRLGEIDDALAELGHKPDEASAAPSARQKAVR